MNIKENNLSLANYVLHDRFQLNSYITNLFKHFHHCSASPLVKDKK